VDSIVREGAAVAARTRPEVQATLGGIHPAVTSEAAGEASSILLWNVLGVKAGGTIVALPVGSGRSSAPGHRSRKY
jgi:hypothetical protein